MDFKMVMVMRAIFFIYSPIPKDSVPREPLPMRDEMVFKSATKIRRIPPSYIPVPHA